MTNEEKLFKWASDGFLATNPLDRTQAEKDLGWSTPARRKAEEGLEGAGVLKIKDTGHFVLLSVTAGSLALDAKQLFEWAKQQLSRRPFNRKVAMGALGWDAATQAAAETELGKRGLIRIEANHFCLKV